MKLEHSLTPYTKINSKWFKDLNINHDTTKLLEENIDKILSDINHGNMFLEQPPKGKEIKAKITKWDLIKLKGFWTAKKKNYQQTKSHIMEWQKKYLQSMQLTKGYYPKYTNSSCNSISKKQATQTKNVQMTFTDIFSKKTYRWPTETQKDAQHH